VHLSFRIWTSILLTSWRVAVVGLPRLTVTAIFFAQVICGTLYALAVLLRADGASQTPGLRRFGHGHYTGDCQHRHTTQHVASFHGLHQLARVSTRVLAPPASRPLGSQLSAPDVSDCELLSLGENDQPPLARTGRPEVYIGGKSCTFTRRYGSTGRPLLRVASKGIDLICDARQLRSGDGVTPGRTSRNTMTCPCQRTMAITVRQGLHWNLSQSRACASRSTSRIALVVDLSLSTKAFLIY